MTTILRKLLVLGMVGMVLVLAGIYEVVRWLTQLGVTDMAGQVADTYLTGTAVAIIVAMVLLLRSDRPRRRYDERTHRPPEYGPPRWHDEPPYYPPRYEPPRYRRRPWWW